MNVKNKQLSSHKIFGLGFGKTGTTSLEKACSILGYYVCNGSWKNNYSNYLMGLYVNHDISRILRITRDYDAFFDAPWGGGADLVPELVKLYPTAKYILSMRDPEEWYESFERELMKPFRNRAHFEEHRALLFDTLHSFGRYGDAWFWPHVFGISGLSGNRSLVIEKYSQQNKNTLATLNSCGCDHLVINVTHGEGWDKLCPFLDVPIPKVPFPHANRNPKEADNTNARFTSRVRRSINGFAHIWLPDK